MNSNGMCNAARQLVLCTGVMGLAAGAPADDTALDFATERVVVFKDGHGLFVKTASGLADADGRLYTDDVPAAAVLGTFWATAVGDRIVGMEAQWVEQTRCTEQETDCLSTLDLLRANQGKRLSLRMVYGETVTGTLVDVLEVPAEPVKLGDPASAGAVGGRGRALAAPRRSAAMPGGGTLAIMQTLAGMEVVVIASIRTITGDDLVSRMTRRTEFTQRNKRLWFDLGAEAAGREVTIRLLYFTPGIRWIPTYRLGGDLDDDGQLALQGEILNEVEDIQDAVLDLVVGVPNFRYTGTVSPLSLERVMVDALQQSAPGLMGRHMSNASFAQRAGEWRGRTHQAQPAAAGDSAAAALAAEITAVGEQDLFVYSIEEFSLAKGDRATVSLWQSSIPLRHLYTMDVRAVRDWRTGAMTMSRIAPGQSNNPSPLRLADNTVWHQLELVNSTGVPWTTGPVMLLRNYLPLGQELLTYTPRGARTLLPVTVAVDVRGTYAEQEINREAKALYWNNHQWARIRKEGTITLTNYRDEPIRMLVTVSTGGKTESASDDATISINATRSADFHGGHAAVNNHSEVTWELNLEAGASRTLTYIFSYYVR